jgi:hypothetical protein
VRVVARLGRQPATVRSAFGRHFDTDLELAPRLGAHLETYPAVDREEPEANDGKDGNTGDNHGRHEGTLLAPAARSPALLIKLANSSAVCQLADLPAMMVCRHPRWPSERAAGLGCTYSVLVDASQCQQSTAQGL